MMGDEEAYALKTINRYIGTGFVMTFGVTLAVLTFIMSLGAIFKVTELLAKGLSWWPVIRIFGYSMPFALSFSIPASALVASLLVFGRLAADGEITAMRACGLSLWQIMAVPLWWALGLAALCVVINSEIAPRAHLAQRAAIAGLGMESPADLLEEGRYIQDFPGLNIYVGHKIGERLEAVRIFDTTDKTVSREIVAKYGTVSATNGGADLFIDLRDVSVDPFYDGKPLFCERWPIEIPNAFRIRAYGKKEGDMTVFELAGNIARIERNFPALNGAKREMRRMGFIVELNERFVLALACVTFVLLGSPLAVMAHRRESSVGVGMSLFIVAGFYLFVILAESLADKPAWHPYLLLWLPILICVAGGWYMVRRAD